MDSAWMTNNKILLECLKHLFNGLFVAHVDNLTTF